MRFSRNIGPSLTLSLVWLLAACSESLLTGTNSSSVEKDPPVVDTDGEPDDLDDDLDVGSDGDLEVDGGEIVKGSDGDDEDDGEDVDDGETDDDHEASLIEGKISEDENGEIVFDEGELVALCETHGKLFNTNLIFPANTGNKCDFGVGDNLSAGSGSQIRAVRRFSQEIEIPTDRNRVFVCDMSISTENRFTVYDDDIVVTLNSWIVAADYLSQTYYNSRNLDRLGDLYKYDFKKIAGSNWPTESVYLGPGVTGNIDTRQNAQTKREGTMSFELSKNFLLAMPKAEIVQPVFDFSFFIHGNRTIDDDCQHSGFDFKVAVRYVD